MVDGNSVAAAVRIILLDCIVRVPLEGSSQTYGEGLTFFIQAAVMVIMFNMSKTILFFPLSSQL